MLDLLIKGADLTMKSTAVTGGCVNMSVLLSHTHTVITFCFFQVGCVSPVPFCQSQLHSVGCAAEALGQLTEEPQDII